MSSCFQIRSTSAFGAATLLGLLTFLPLALHGQGTAPPTLIDRNLTVNTVVSGLSLPTSMAFLGDDDFFVGEKASGKVKRVLHGVVSEVLDLPVNSSSERGLLGIALHPNFPNTPQVFLYWTCAAPPPPTSAPFNPTLIECADPPVGTADTADILAVPLLGNRVDRFIWNAGTSSLVFDRNLIKMRVFQNDGGPDPAGQGDSAQLALGNHNGGVIRFGPDGNLYVITGDRGRRGQLQNLTNGPTPPTADDQFGGPAPDNAHFAGMILRISPVDGSAPADNPFFAAGAAIGGEAGRNIQKMFAYGIRNSFGMAFNPTSGELWAQENGDDTFDEVNLVEPGMNGGWVQIMGPVSRIAEFKQIEVTRPPSALQQLRWPPTNIAGTPQEALSRLFMLPGAHYSDPEFSWKYAVAPAGLGFVNGMGLGGEYKGDMILGASTPVLEGGYLFRFKMTGNGKKLVVEGHGREDGVADNTDKNDITESEELLFGRNFGVGTDIQTGPDGNLYVVSLSKGAVYEISGRAPRRQRQRQ